MPIIRSRMNVNIVHIVLQYKIEKKLNIIFMTGQNSQGAVGGDPAMGNMSPSEQYLKKYTFASAGDQFDTPTWGSWNLTDNKCQVLLSRRLAPVDFLRQ